MSNITIITVTRIAWSTTAYQVDWQRPGKRPCSTSAHMDDPGAAAAQAVSVAMTVDGPYAIMGPSAVMAMIPEGMRSRQ